MICSVSAAGGWLCERWYALYQLPGAGYMGIDQLPGAGYMSVGLLCISRRGLDIRAMVCFVSAAWGWLYERVSALYHLLGAGYISVGLLCVICWGLAKCAWVYEQPMHHE